MSHPLLVEAIESFYVPVLIHNNKPGEDEKILKKFQERAWNNPVIRFLSADEKDILPRQDGVWATGAVARRLADATVAWQKLRNEKARVPEYLRFVMAEENGHNATATFAMHCYWQGEVDFGGLPGVKHTQAGWLHGKEVVEVVYDPTYVSYEKLIDTARKLKCASTVFARTEEQLKIAQGVVGKSAVLSEEKTRPAKESDQHYYLRKTPLRYLPLTPMQATKINSALLRRVDYSSFLSPRQTQLLKEIQEISARRQDSDFFAKLEKLRPPRDVEKLFAYQEQLEALLVDDDKTARN